MLIHAVHPFCRFCVGLLALLCCRSKAISVQCFCMFSCLCCTADSRNSRDKLLRTVLRYFLCLRQQVMVSALRDELHVLTAKQAPPNLALDSPKKSKPSKKKAPGSQATTSTITPITMVSSCKSLSSCKTPFPPPHLPSHLQQPLP